MVAFGAVFFFFFKQKTAYEMRISDWSSDVCSSDLRRAIAREIAPAPLSLWSAEPTRARPGLILGITNLSERRAPKACAALSSLITESAAEGRRPRAIDSHSAFDDSRARQPVPVPDRSRKTDRKSTRLNSSH